MPDRVQHGVMRIGQHAGEPRETREDQHEPKPARLPRLPGQHSAADERPADQDGNWQSERHIRDNRPARADVADDPSSAQPGKQSRGSQPNQPRAQKQIASANLYDPVGWSSLRAGPRPGQSVHHLAGRNSPRITDRDARAPAAPRSGDRRATAPLLIVQRSVTTRSVAGPLAVYGGLTPGGHGPNLRQIAIFATQPYVGLCIQRMQERLAAVKTRRYGLGDALGQATSTVGPVTTLNGGRTMGAVRWLHDRLAGDTSGCRLAAGPVVFLPDLPWLGALRTRGAR